MGAPDTRRVDVADGVALSVRVWRAGELRPFLLVHGLASNARMWDGVVDALQQLGHPVATVDLRGHGRSDKPDDGYDVGTVAGDVAAVVTALGWDRPVVAGQSWGGNVVLELAARQPSLVAGVVAVDGGTIELARSLPDWEDCAAALAPPPTEGMARADLEAGMRARHPDWPPSGIAGVLACWETREDGTVAPWLTRPCHLAALGGLWEHRPTALYPSIEVPVLFIPAGAQPLAERAAAAVPRGRVHAVDGDHDLHAQHPERVARILHDATADGFFS